MNAKKKAKLSTFWFMVKSNFQASPILFPILIILYMMVIVIGAFLLFIVKDATNSMIDVIEGTGTVDRVFRLVGIYLVSQLVIILVINWFQDTTAEKTFVQFDAYYKKLCMYKFGKLPQENMYDNEVYEKYQFTYWNIYMFEMMPWQLIQFFVNFGFSKLLYLGIIFAFNIYLGLYCLLLLIINILLGIFVNRQFTDVNKAQTQPRRIQNYFKELLSSKKYVKETKTYRLERYFYEKVKEMYLKMRDAYYKVYRLNEITNQGVFFANFLFRIGLIVILIYTVYLGQLNVGEAALIQIAGTSLINVSWQFKQPVGNFVRYLGAAPTMIEMLYPVSKEERKEMKKVDYDDFSLQLGEFQKIEIHNASYKYPSREEDVVKNINLTINKGDIISILGYNGSGKTTTAKLISGVLNPTSGSILFNGENVSNIDIKEYYKYFGIGFQDFAKYSLTLRENIGFGRINDLDNDEYIDESIKKANLKPILKKMPEGLNTVLGKEFAKKGQDLSGGEWQKIILSRAYMGSPEILILDEPTASIDPFEEERMLEEFDQILKGKTAILISHRISFARLADKIVMMKNGEIVETGNHTELLKLKGYYHELFMSQQNLYIDGGDIDE